MCRSNRITHERQIEWKLNIRLPVLIPSHFGLIGALVLLLFAYLMILGSHLTLPVNANFTIIFRCHFWKCKCTPLYCRAAVAADAIDLLLLHVQINTEFHTHSVLLFALIGNQINRTNYVWNLKLKKKKEKNQNMFAIRKKHINGRRQNSFF